MLGGSARLTARTEELAQAHVPVGEVGEFVDEPVTQALSLVELTGMNQIDDLIRHPINPLVLIDDGSPAGGQSVGRG